MVNIRRGIKEIAELPKKLLEKLVLEYESIRNVDSVVDVFVDDHNREDPRKVMPFGLKDIADEMNVPEIFFMYKKPRNFDNLIERKLGGEDLEEKLEHTTIISKGSDMLISTEIVDALEPYCKKFLAGDKSAAPIAKTYKGKKIFALPIFGGMKKEYVGIIGMVSKKDATELDEKMLTQASSRLDRYIRDRILQSERHRIMRKCAQSIGKTGLEGIGEALIYLTEFTEVNRAALVYLKDKINPAVEPNKREICLVWSEGGKVLEKHEEYDKLNHGVGGAMIAYHRKHIDDSKYGSRILKILETDDNGEEKHNYFSCQDLTNMPKDPSKTIGKLILIGGDQEMRQADLDLAESVALELYGKISWLHEQQKALGRSLHPAQVDFFIKKPTIAEWFFQNPREEIIAMAYTDLCGYTAITRELKNPRLTIEGAKRWILKEKELLHKYGGYFDKEVGDCVVGHFGPPFCGVSMDSLNKINSMEELTDLVARSQSEPHVYAYQSVLYVLESMEAVKTFRMGEKVLNISAGIEVGNIALGDTTDVIGKLTAMGDDMNLAARLQHEAGHGELLIGPKCFNYLEIYRKEAYLQELPFNVVKKGDFKLKGYEELVPAWTVMRK